MMEPAAKADANTDSIKLWKPAANRRPVRTEPAQSGTWSRSAMFMMIVMSIARSWKANRRPACIRASSGRPTSRPLVFRSGADARSALQTARNVLHGPSCRSRRATARHTRRYSIATAGRRSLRRLKSRNDMSGRCAGELLKLQHEHAPNSCPFGVGEDPPPRRES